MANSSSVEADQRETVQLLFLDSNRVDIIEGGRGFGSQREGFAWMGHTKFPGFQLPSGASGCLSPSISQACPGDLPDCHRGQVILCQETLQPVQFISQGLSPHGPIFHLLL